MIEKWDDLKFFSSGEWQVLEEKLSDWDIQGVRYTPRRQDIFKAMDLCEFKDVKVCIVGQDPYPEAKYATGLAFSIPRKSKSIPPSCAAILAEYSDDLHMPIPLSGNLEGWCSEGILLWNAVPVCLPELPMYVYDYPEWEYLNQAVVGQLNDKGGVVFCFVGARARKLAQYVSDLENNRVIEVGHPSPRNKTRPFKGCRMFSTINGCLTSLGRQPVEWRL